MRPAAATSLAAPAALLALALPLAGCAPSHSGPPDVDTDMTFAGGLHVDEETLDKGREEYILYCRQCHGDSGRGDGPSSFGLRPAPRDFTQAQFKFGWVVDGLPSDAELERIVRGGLHGTAMLPWDIPHDELYPILQYIKTYAAEEWTTGRLGTPVVPAGADPWQGRVAQAVTRGREVYHGVAQCWSCHPAYETNQSIHDRSGQSAFRESTSFPVAKASSYRRGEGTLTILPPDFTWSPIRSMRTGHELEDLYRVIGAGIPGTAMPSWKGALPEEDLWALAHYVKSLSDLRDTEHASRMRDEIDRQAAPQLAPPPVPAAPAPAPPGETIPVQPAATG